jgi:hypothetical protein
MRLIVIVGILSLVGGAAAQAETMKGMIALATCAEAGKTTPKEHAGCAERLNRDDELLVFVNYKDKKAYDVIEEDKVEQFIGKSVEIEGQLDQGFVDIVSIKAGKDE